MEASTETTESTMKEVEVVLCPRTPPPSPHFGGRLTRVVVALSLTAQLSKVKEVQMDSNPFKSPPPELLAEGLATVMQYLRVRIQRTDAMHDLIQKRYVI